MTVKGEEIPEFVRGWSDAQRAVPLSASTSRPWKRGWRAWHKKERYRLKFQDRELRQAA